MVPTRTVFAIIALSSGVAFGQSGITAAAPPSFDAAEIRNSAHVTNPGMRGGVLRGGRYDVRTASMLELIANAYSMDQDKVQGGPAWLEVDHFDISAKAPEKTPPAAVKLMLQRLLADRFALKVHKEDKPMQAFALTVPKGGKPKLKEASDSETPGCQGVPQNNPPGAIGYNVVECKAQTMDDLAQDLRDMANGYVTNPAVNQTGIDGRWDFTIKWTSRGQLAAAGSDGISIFDAVEKQLGLKLEPGKVPVSVLVVDSANEKPTPNAADIAKVLPNLAPAEFEVADVKPSKPDAGETRAQIRNGRVNAENITLKDIIQYGWEDLPDERLAGAPKFLDSAKFDIVAKAPTPEVGTEIDDEDLRHMVRTLMEDRFKMKWHMEERPVEGYVLSLPSGAKPKMAKADPSHRTGCKDDDPGPSGKDPRLNNPILRRLVTCYNITMAQFVDQLPNLANGYAHVDVLDATGLTGAYDFTLNFSTIGQLRGNGDGQPLAANNGETATPNGAVSLPDAVNKTMGLKLELKKRPMQVLVIDHIEEKPTEN